MMRPVLWLLLFAVVAEARTYDSRDKRVGDFGVTDLIGVIKFAGLGS
jgi:hypothetical protein